MLLMIHRAHDKPTRSLRNVDTVYIALNAHQVYGSYQYANSSQHPANLVFHHFVYLTDVFRLLDPLLCLTFL